MDSISVSFQYHIREMKIKSLAKSVFSLPIQPQASEYKEHTQHEEENNYQTLSRGPGAFHYHIRVN